MSRDVFSSWMYELKYHETEFKVADDDDSQFIDEHELEHVYVQWSKADVKKFLSEHGGKDSQLSFRDFLQTMLDNQDIHRSFIIDAIPATTKLKHLNDLKLQLQVLLAPLEPTVTIVPSLSTRGFRALQISLERYIPTQILDNGIFEAIQGIKAFKKCMPDGYIIKPQVQLFVVVLLLGLFGVDSTFFFFFLVF